MALQFIRKRFTKRPSMVVVPQYIKLKEEAVKITQTEKKEVEDVKQPKIKNNKKNRKEDMINRDQITEIEAAMEKMQPEVKVVKSDRGLIERTESSKIIITEDNRQVLND